MKSIQLQTTEQFDQYRAGIQAILAPYQSVLLDDFSQPDHTPSQDLSGWLTENTCSCLPWIWVLTDERQTVNALVAFTQVIPGRFAYIHGVSQPPPPNQSTLQKWNRQAAISQFARQVLAEAFALGNFHKVKAEFEADNRGAQGFCRRMGFQREARFVQDNRIAGQWRDVLVYSLFRDQFTERWCQPPEHFAKTIPNQHGDPKCLSDDKNHLPKKWKSRRRLPSSKSISTCPPAIATSAATRAVWKRLKASWPL